MLMDEGKVAMLQMKGADSSRIFRGGFGAAEVWRRWQVCIGSVEMWKKC